LPPEDNIDLMANKECRRNKKLKKEVKAYKLDYSEFLSKKQHTEQKRLLRIQRSSNAKLSLNKHSLPVINS
jgi:arsenate reductase-like glutaredoxin family protein